MLLAPALSAANLSRAYLRLGWRVKALLASPSLAPY